MADIRTILCPVDFSTLTRREIDLAVDLARAFGAKLVLHFNLDAASPGLTMGWMWNQVNVGEKVTEASAEEALKQLLAELPPDVEGEARLSQGPVGQSVLYLAAQLPADLLLLASHGASTEEHRSVAERLIDQSSCPVLVLHEGDAAASGVGLDGASAPLLVADDGSSGAARALAFARSLAARLPFELHLLRVAESGGGAAALDEARAELGARLPEDLRAKSHLHVVTGEPEAEIAAAASRLGARWIVMGTHARGLLRRLFTRDTAQAMLHRAPCPICFVPASWTG